MTTPMSAVCPCPRCRQGIDHPDRAFHQRLNLVLGRLEENQRRRLAALEAEQLGRGGDRLMAQIAAWTRRPSAAGGGSWPAGWRGSRSGGCGGRVAADRRSKKDPAILTALGAAVEPETAGDPTAGETVSKAEMVSLNLERHPVCPTWNYTLRPRSAPPPTTTEQPEQEVIL